ncbi:MAG: hypothetical protein ACR2JH_02230 [Solirubrobacteraceae bacterium]
MSNRLLVLLALLAGLSAAGLPAAAAGASGPAAVIADCNSHLKLTQSYSAVDLRSALTTMPASVKEYTNCYDVIQRSLLSRLGKSVAPGAVGSGSSGGSSFSAPVIIVLAVLLLGAAGFGVQALRRRSP